MMYLKMAVFAAILTANSITLAEENHLHEHEKIHDEKTSHAEHVESPDVIEISPDSQKEANIKTTILKPQKIASFVHAPGEVIPNINQSSKITPRISSQVIKRYVNVGDEVNVGQKLVLLSSVEMAKAQSDLLLTYHEWLRVKELGKQAIGAKRYQSAQINYRHALAKLIAYGMTKEQANKFLSALDSSSADGQYSLLSSQNGIVFSADVTEGEMVEAGHVLYHILDETSLWVEAKLSNGDAQLVKQGASAFVGISKRWVEGEVLQIHHQLDETTRTQSVLISIPNKDDALHPGQFVNCRIVVGEGSEVLAVPEAALLRTADGDWAIYIEIKPNHFKQQEVTLVETRNNLAIIKNVNPGVKVVTSGAFAVHSELLKSGFQVHSH